MQGLLKVTGFIGRLRGIALALPLLAFAPGCGGDSDSEPASEAEPWMRQFTLGNFSINSAPILTHQDGESHSYVTDYVAASALPNVNLEFFTVHAYLPSVPSLETKIEQIRVTAGRVDGSRTGNIYEGGEFFERASLSGETYSVYRLSGFTSAAPPLTPASFANVVYELVVNYQQAGSVMNTSNWTIEIYKR